MEESIALRKFHNEIKSIVISKYSSLHNNPRLLDIGCGRGGDIHKWRNNNISEAIGIDINRSYVKQAISRLKSLNNFHNFKFYYTHSNMIYSKFFESRQIPYTNCFEIITCMFAFHYFCATQASLQEILSQVSNSLVKNGHFIIICPSGDKIHELFESKQTDEIKTSMMYIKKNYTTPNYIGDSIDFMLSGTLYFGETMLSSEYLVFKDVLINAASKYNLKLKENSSFADYFSHMHKMNQDTKDASFLNSIFVFQKCK